MSCLFDSVSSFTKNCSSSDLRSIVVHYLQSDPVYWDTMRFGEVFPFFPPEDVHGCSNVNEYVERMKYSHTWGGAIEIQAMCNLFQISIRVHVLNHHRGRPSSPPPITFVPAAASAASSPPQVVLDVLWTGNHFDPLHK